MTVSPLAPALQPDLPEISGVKLATTGTGVKYKDRADLLLAILEPAATIAACFTTSKTASAPVEICKKNLSGGKARAIIVNAGNANAFTGKKGESSAKVIGKTVADALQCPPEQVFMASTGVIGEPLDPTSIITAVDELAQTARPDAWQQAARAIMTTDTYLKQATITTRINGHSVTINGIAKGSGMIAPDMATMLVFIFTDASLPQEIAQSLLSASVEKSFNAITVDSDTSTSDTVLLCATGSRKTDFSGASDVTLKDFATALDDLTRNLAHQVVRDGEGAEKFISITVSGAENDRAARTIGLSIANSPLVKTAIAGEDANWGRIVMAVGKAGEKADRDSLSIEIGGIKVASHGEIDPNYREADLVPYMKGREIDIKVDVGIAGGTSTVWTCDLTHRYIEINADYRS
jgi:glutamate N-acetyltransferase/amino-acid N-acetyltransferase